MSKFVCFSLFLVQSLSLVKIKFQILGNGVNMRYSQNHILAFLSILSR